MYFTLSHKTGKYIVEKIGTHPNGILVQVINVINHPTQGDLHARKEVEGVFFHERKALSHLEKRVVDENLLKPYVGEVTDYVTSLKQALDKMTTKLNQEDTPFNQKSLACLTQLKKDYEAQHKTTF